VVAVTAVAFSWSSWSPRTGVPGSVAVAIRVAVAVVVVFEAAPCSPC
jgi:hypothetical protein